MDTGFPPFPAIGAFSAKLVYINGQLGEILVASGDLKGSQEINLRTINLTDNVQEIILIAKVRKPRKAASKPRYEDHVQPGRFP